jgi:hypothetical protein
VQIGPRRQRGMQAFGQQGFVESGIHAGSVARCANWL